jgi:DNA-binding transcriptional LysR family regulator
VTLVDEGKFQFHQHKRGRGASPFVGVPTDSAACHDIGTDMALEAALAEHGVALARYPLVQSNVETGRLVRPFALALPSPFSFRIVCRWEHADSAKIHAFRTWAQRMAAAA